MATQATDIQFERPSLLARVGAGLDRALNVLVSMAEANPRMKAVTRLSELSDEELAARGLKREDIVRHVFRDIYYV
ncbi:DUF1127 domain-containing protein [Vannielia litorea]|uniref:DUF1127 domain-containing protein n=1 Tax=Vannielia litorea TaxID=1217970 RepID=UPI001BCF2BE4|nr:DUF1127 domain-containing protein [Vannielia litorea]MBS8228760.1 DUF1127 domain-containing protein [Vannielia litorea]